MMRLMQGHRASRVLPRTARRRDQHGADGCDIGHLGAGYAREQHHRGHHDDVQPAAHLPDRALQEFDQAHRHAVGFHEIADENEERNS
jgi:hypothetical protein